MGILVVVGFLLVMLVVVVLAFNNKSEEGEEKLPSEFIAAMNVAGINRNGCQMKHVGTFIGKLVREPDNEFDENAIKVLHEDGTHIGYIKSEDTAAVRQMLGDKFKKYPVVGQVKFVEDKDDDDLDDEEIDENLVKIEDVKAGYFVARIYIDSAHL